MKKLTLSVKDRLELPAIFPDKGGFIQQEIVESIKVLIRFTPAELEDYKLKDLPDGRIIWDNTKAKDCEFKFEDSAIEVMKKGVDNLDKNESIPSALFPLCKRIREIT